MVIRRNFRYHVHYLIGLRSNKESFVFQYGDDASFLESVTGTFESECTNSMKSKIPIFSNDPEARETQRAGLRTVEGNICPNRCSGYGTCDNSVCTCDPGKTELFKHLIHCLSAVTFNPRERTRNKFFNIRPLCIA